MEETVLGQDGPANDQFSLSTSFVTIFETFEQNLKDEFTRRAARDQEILAELQSLRQASLKTQIPQRQDSRLHVVLDPEHREVLERRPFSEGIEPKYHDWHEKYRKLSKKHGKLRLDRDNYQTLFNQLKDRRRKDEEIVQQWSDWSDRTSKRRSRSKDSEYLSQNPRSNSLVPLIENRPFPLSRIELPPKISENLPTHRTIPADLPEPAEGANSPTLFDQLDPEPITHSSRSFGQIYSTELQDDFSNDNDEPQELPPVLKRNSNIDSPRALNAYGRRPPLTAEDDKENREPPSSLSTISQSSTQEACDEDTTLIGITDDIPVVICAYPVKKKRPRGLDETGHVHNKSDSGRGIPGNPLRVKSEQGSSSPLMVMRQPAGANDSEALDLDDVQDKIPTPKRLCRFAHQSNLWNDTSRRLFRHDPSRANSEPMEAFASQTHERDGQMRYFLENVGQRRSLTPNIGRNADDMFSGDLESLRQHDLSPSTLTANTISALQSKDKNRKQHPRSPDTRAKKKNKGGRPDPSRGIAAIPTISEDGDIPLEFDVMSTYQTTPLDLCASRAVGAVGDEREGLKNKAVERFMDLLDNPSPARGPLSPIVSKPPPLANQSTSRAQCLSTSRAHLSAMPAQLSLTGTKHSKDFPGLSTTPTATSPIVRSLPNPRNNSNQHPHNSSGESRSTFGQTRIKVPHGAFRKLPINLLTREHFRINPDCNKGVSYAYSEVVRRKEERKCLPGCTRPACCGAHFRRLIESGLQVHPDENLWAPEGENEGIRLVMEYTRWSREVVQKLAEDDMERLLIVAKIQKAANLFGKHRHIYDRAPSPPGFWDTDFPSTQELARHRELANEMERERIEVRRKEAMKTKGLWKFADE